MVARARPLQTVRNPQFYSSKLAALIMGPFQCFSLNPSKMLYFLFAQLPITFSFTSADDGFMNRTYWKKKKRVSKLLFISPKLPALNGCEPVLRPLWWKMVCICTYGHIEYMKT